MLAWGGCPGDELSWSAFPWRIKDAHRAAQPYWTTRFIATTGDVLRLAANHHTAGRLDEAMVLYRLVLRADPVNSDGWRLLGKAVTKAGDRKAGLACLRRLIAFCPADATAFAECAAPRPRRCRRPAGCHQPASSTKEVSHGTCGPLGDAAGLTTVASARAVHGQSIPGFGPTDMARQSR